MRPENGNVMVQLSERLFTTQEDPGLNPVISNIFLWLFTTQEDLGLNPAIGNLIAHLQTVKKRNKVRLVVAQ